MNEPTALFVIGVKPVRIGGVELHARELTRRLAKAGWRSVICFHHLPKPEVAAYLADDSVTFEELPLPWGHSPGTVRILSGLLRKHRPRIVHFQFTPWIGPFPWLAKLWGAEQVYFTDQGSHPEGFDPQPAAAWKRMIGRAATKPYDAIFCISEYNCEAVRIRGLIDGARVRRIFNATEVSRAADPEAGAEFRRRFRIPEDRIVVAQVSWIIREKGVADLLEAAAKAAAVNPRLHFLLVGEGTYRDRYAWQALELGLGERITWAGLVQDPFGEGVYAAADICCQMSRWEEAFGYVIAEAMVHAKPVVATRVGGIPEVVEDGVTGLLVERGNVDQMAEKILELAASPERREELGRAGRRRAEELFDVRKNVEQLAEYYGLE